MIRDFKPVHQLEPSNPFQMQCGPWLGASIIAGLVLLLVPRGMPWSGQTFFSPVVMGRNIATLGFPLFVAWGCHLAVSLGYGLVICRVVASVRQTKAILTGAVIGLILYGLNLGLAMAFLPQILGDEPLVALTHGVFGLVAAGAYRGLLRRKSADSTAA